MPKLKRPSLKGNQNASKPEAEHRVQLSTTIAPHTSKKISRLEGVYGGKGHVVDDAVDKLQEPVFGKARKIFPAIP